MLKIMPPNHVVVEISIIISVEMEHKCSSFLYIEHVAQHDQNTPFQQDVFLAAQPVFVVSYLHDGLAVHKLRNPNSTNISFHNKVLLTIDVVM
jgi:hypothetical protein